MKLKALATSTLLSMSVFGLSLSATNAEETLPSIAGTAAASEDFTTLVAALTAAELVDAVDRGGPFTVFAPTNEAFAKLPEETLAHLLSEEGKTDLINILLYHVLPGETLAEDLAGQTLEAGTAMGGYVSIDGTMDGVMVNDATVIAADIETSNGIIHAIDTVLIPESNF